MKLRRVAGNSMYPTLREGAVCLFVSKNPRVGSIVLAVSNSREVVKRLERVEGNRIYLVGDNRQESTDSRHYGYLDRSAILGVRMITFPAAILPPKPLRSNSRWLGRVAAFILIAMALLHLYRIDTFIPILDNTIPGGQLAASLVALGIIMSEIFAVPFALRMKLSPLGHLISGALVAFAPLWWLLIAIWSYGYPGNVGILGSFVDIPGAAVVVVVCLAWVAFNYYTLYSLGYNKLTAARTLRK